jgi:uncharacterized protein YjbJ (UPF0337 family)
VNRDDPDFANKRSGEGLRVEGRVLDATRDRPTSEDRKETEMNWDQIEGSWREFTGGVKERWGKLTDDELTSIGGKRDRLAGVLQKKYGMAKDKVEEEIADFERSLDDTRSTRH